MDLISLPTPAAILDIGRVKRNASRMREIALENGVRLRPHIKTHKCIEVARIQTEGFDGAVTVSTLAEARAFAENGFSDITYAVPVERGKFGEAIDIVRGGAKFNLLTDDADTVATLDRAAGDAGVRFDVFVEIDVGDHRSGVEPNTPEAINIPQQVSDARNLNFAGILTHAGHSYNVRTKSEIVEIARQERDIMVKHAERLRSMSINVPTVSIGSTPSITHVDHLDGVDEIRPGNYIFFDGFQATLGSCTLEDTALTVLASVVHRDTSRKKLIVDAGAIALSKDRGAVELDASCGYGRVLDLDGSDTGMRVTSVSQEHGQMVAPDDAVFDRFRVGDRLRILANHSCLTAAQHSHYNVIENGQIVDRWQVHQGW